MCITEFILLQGGVDDSGAASVRAILHWQYRTICRGSNSILQNLFDIMGPKAHDYISFYGLRAYGKLYDGGPVATSQVGPWYWQPCLLIQQNFFSLSLYCQKN